MGRNKGYVRRGFVISFFYKDGLWVGRFYFIGRILRGREGFVFYFKGFLIFFGGFFG